MIEAIIAEAVITEEKLKPKADEENEFAVFHNVIPTKGAEIPEAMHDDSGKQDTTKTAVRTVAMN